MPHERTYYPGSPFRPPPGHLHRPGPRWRQRNAIIIGLGAAGLPKDQRNKAILIGIIAATVLRIGFAAITTQLLQIVGLLLVGGILLLWVCWKMWRELRAGHSQEATDAIEGRDTSPDGSAPRKTFAQAAWLIVVADVSMSLDNVLAVAGAARDHLTIMIFGLILSIAMMGLAATYIAPPAAAVSLDRLCRPRDHPLCRAGDDLPGSP